MDEQLEWKGRLAKPVDNLRSGGHIKVERRARESAVPSGPPSA